jgi:hypothetical protein
MQSVTTTAPDMETIDALRIECHNASPPEPLSPYGWTDEWFTSTFLPLVPVRESHQEMEALQNFARWGRTKGGQPQTA